MKQGLTRKRIILICLVASTMALGFLSRSTLVTLPKLLASYAGDILWATMVYFIVGFIAPTWKTKKTAMVALAFAFTIEFSQLVHAPWIDQIRDHKIGALILGHTFIASDLVCYSVGVLLGAVVDLFLTPLTKT